MNLHLPLALVTVSALSACATTPSPTSLRPSPNAATSAIATTGKDDGMVCHRETPIGSNRSKRVCRPANEIEADARASQDAMRRIQQKTGGTAER